MTAQEEIAPLGDVPVDIKVELDRRVMTTREVLQLEEGRHGRRFDGDYQPFSGILSAGFT